MRRRTRCVQRWFLAELYISALSASKVTVTYGSLLTHGARSVLIRAGAMEKPDRLRAWALKVYSRRGHNKATVAVANKLARTVWAVWKHNTEFQSYPKAS